MLPSAMSQARHHGRALDLPRWASRRHRRKYLRSPRAWSPVADNRRGHARPAGPLTHACPRRRAPGSRLWRRRRNPEKRRGGARPRPGQRRPTLQQDRMPASANPGASASTPDPWPPERRGPPSAIDARRRRAAPQATGQGALQVDAPAVLRPDADACATSKPIWRGLTGA
jgi:hypothetical protein